MMVLPFLAGWIYWLVLPTLRTLLGSVERGSRLNDKHDPLSSFGGGLTGGHYSFLFDHGVWGVLGRGLLLAAVPLLVVGLVAPLLAFAVNEGGTILRLAARLLLAIPVAGFAPMLVGTAWLNLVSSQGPFTVHDQGFGLQWTVFSLATLGLAAGIAVAFYLSALRRRIDQPLPTSGATIGNLAVIWGVVGLGTLAFSLQAFTFNSVVFPSGQSDSGLVSFSYRLEAMTFLAGQADAAQSLLLVILFVLGLVAGVLLLASRSRLELDPVRASAGLLGPASRDMAIASGVLGLVGVVVAVLIDLFPRLGLFTGPPGYGHETTDNGRLLVNTLLPPMIGAIVQVLTAYLAGLGIGAFRPLGRHSRWLLMLFAPWLFVTAAAVSTELVRSLAEHNDYDTWWGLIPPILVSVPALFLFTMFSDGQAAKYRAGAGPFTRVVVIPALPLIALVAIVLILLGSVDVLWPILAGRGPNTATGSMHLLDMRGRYYSTSPSFTDMALAAPFGVLALIGLALLHVTYLDRLALRTAPATTEPICHEHKTHGPLVLGITDLTPGPQAGRPADRGHRSAMGSL